MTARDQAATSRVVTTFSASAPGILSVGASLAGVALPAGRLFTALERDEDAHVGWISLEKGTRLGTTWRALAATFGQHGLWPVVLSSLNSDDGRPWLDGELGFDDGTPPERLDTAEELAAQWSQVVPLEDGGLAAIAPFGRVFPGLAPASSGPDALASLVRVVDALDGRLGLVPVTRPADVPFAVGWSGPVNHYSDMGLLSAVLRSWETRFGAVLVGIGFDTITLAVERPVKDLKTATALAAEHFAICSDSVWQGAGSIEALAHELLGATRWDLWWD